MKATACVNHVPRCHKVEVTIGDLDQPAMVRETCLPRSLPSQCRFPCTRRHLDIAMPRHSDQLGAHPQRISDVLKHMGTDGEVELPIRKRPGISIADITAHPGVAGETLSISSLGSR